jgi:hypothetical protein
MPPRAPAQALEPRTLTDRQIIEATGEVIRVGDGVTTRGEFISLGSVRDVGVPEPSRVIVQANLNRDDEIESIEITADGTVDVQGLHCAPVAKEIGLQLYGRISALVETESVAPATLQQLLGELRQSTGFQR